MRFCTDCGIEVGRYSTRCKSCAAVHRNAMRADAVYLQLAVARSAPRKPRSKRMGVRESRVRFTADDLRHAIYAEGFTIAQVEKLARLPKGSLSEALRKKTMTYSLLDKVACVIERHYSEFEVVA